MLLRFLKSNKEKPTLKKEGRERVESGEVRFLPV